MVKEIKARVSVQVTLDNSADLTEEEKKAIASALSGTLIKQMTLDSLQGEPGATANATILHDMIDMHHHESPHTPVA